MYINITLENVYRGILVKATARFDLRIYNCKPRMLYSRFILFQRCYNLLRNIDFRPFRDDVVYTSYILCYPRTRDLIVFVSRYNVGIVVGTRPSLRPCTYI